MDIQEELLDWWQEEMSGLVAIFNDKVQKYYNWETEEFTDVKQMDRAW